MSDANVIALPARVKNITGKRFGRLVVLSYFGRLGNGKHAWNCLCDCGGRIVVKQNAMSTGNTTSCGCLRVDTAKANSLKAATHRMTNTPEYRSWQAMMRRCYTPSVPEYSRYGGRGILTCESWKKFDNFYADMGPRPQYATLDRIDNNGNYEPGNCRWATAKEQSRNRRSNRLLTIDGATKTVAELAESTGLSPHTIYARLARGDSHVDCIRNGRRTNATAEN